MQGFHRRDVMGLGLAAAAAALTAGPARAQGAPDSVERWGLFEAALSGRARATRSMSP